MAKKRLTWSAMHERLMALEYLPGDVLAATDDAVSKQDVELASKLFCEACHKRGLEYKLYVRVSPWHVQKFAVCPTCNSFWLSLP